MRILLIKPSHREIYGQFKNIAPEYPPLGLAYVAAVLEGNGHEVRIIDIPVEMIDESKFEEILRTFSPQLIGITSVTSTITYSLALCGIIKHSLPNVTVVLGGPHPSTMPNEVLSNPNVDFVVRGEGEMTMLDLVNTLENNGILRRVLGISWRNSGVIVRNDSRPYIEDLDSLPWPARKLS